MTETLFSDSFPTELGTLSLIADAKGRLRALGWKEDHPRMERFLANANVVERRDPSGLSAKLRRYFDGQLDVLDGIPVAFAGTPFQESVWSTLQRIPLGETWSYGRLAREIGNPKAVRAVGLANGRNPIAVVVPCHRVIGADGSLTGYGGGVFRKRWLLEHEGINGLRHQL
jgi:methylated-DNA-[protein]-cysteine S-methyltransferase